MSVEKVRNELMNKIDSTNEIEIEKVERYVNLLNLFYELDKAVEEHGTIITTINASQRFTKPNPALSEKNKISASLLALEKSFNYIDGPVEEVKSKSKKEEPVKKGVDALI